ncbi:hypothetical protein FKM82_026722 [Ascaphus truei]
MFSHLRGTFWVTWIAEQISRLLLTRLNAFSWDRCSPVSGFRGTFWVTWIAEQISRLLPIRLNAFSRQYHTNPNAAAVLFFGRKQVHFNHLSVSRSSNVWHRCMTQFSTKQNSPPALNELTITACTNNEYIR